MEIILHCGDRFDRLDARGRAERQPRAFVVGQMTRPFVVRPAARIETWGIRFRPGGAAAFLDGGLQELTGQVVDLETVWGAEGRRCVEWIGEARHPSERRRRIEAMLLDRLRRGVDPIAHAAARSLVAARGRLRIAALASEAGIGMRQFERRFLRGVGLPPRLLGRILRFQHLFRLAPAASTPATWADRALDAGYYDQAHLLRDFREFAGSTPPRFLAEQGEFSRALTSRDRLDHLFTA
jgi:AraC-like DNA-binding protein